VQSEISVEAGSHSLRDHLARAVGGEAVDHDPVEASQRPHLPGSLAAERLEASGLLQARDHAAHEVAGAKVLWRAGFGLNDDGPA
jgi:hypothetical protein